MELSSPIFLLLLFSAMGGGIAYIGDWLGRKMGKKRLRLAGLRPRHTATLMTVFVGMLIPIATTLALLGISQPVREWLRRGPEIVSEMQGVIKEREVLVAERNVLRTETKTLNITLTYGQRKLEETEKARASADKQRMAAENSLTLAERKVASAQEQNTRLTREGQALARRNTSLLSDVEELKTERTQLVSERGKLRKDIERFRVEVSKLNSDSIALALQLNETENQLGVTKRQLELGREEVRFLTDKVIQPLREEQDRLESNIRGLRSMRTSQLMLRKGEELARLTLSPGTSAESVQAALDQLIKSADAYSRERGISPGDSKPAAAMQPILREMPDGSRITISVEDQVRSLVEPITTATQGLVMIARSYYNYFDQDNQQQLPVPVQVDVFFNKIVYQEGDIVAQGVLDGAMPEDQVLEAVFEFVQTRVRQQAEAAGLIPVYGQESSIGEVTTEQILTLVDQIRLQGASVRVVAKAARQTRAAETLRLKFELQP